MVVGASAPGFASMGALAKDVMDAGAGGVMIAPPATLKTDDQIVAYYANAAEAIGDDVPFVMQDYPYASGVFMAPAVIRRIVEDNPSCVMVKHEEWPGLDKLTALKSLMADGGMRKVAILCGNGGVFLPHELERGADGAKTGYAYPEMLVQLVRLIKAGERAAAHDCSTGICRCCATSSSPGCSGLRCANTSSSAAARSPAMRSASRASSCRRKRSPRSSS